MALINVKTIAKAKDRNSMVTKGGVVYQSVDTAALAEVANIAKNLASNSSDWAKIDQKDKAVLAAALKSLAAAMEESDGKYLSKVHADTAAELITFLKGFVSQGTALLRGGAEFGNFVKDASGAALYMDNDGLWHCETDFMHVRHKLTAKEVQIEEVTHIGGQQLLTAAQMNCAFVADKGDYYRCFFNKEGSDGRKVTNKWKTGDQAYACTFNLEEQADGTLGNHYFWRLVTGTSNDGADTSEYEVDGETVNGGDYHYIDLSKSVASSGSDEPKPGDNIVQLGYRGTDIGAAERQAAILMAGAGNASPYIREFTGINSFSLPEPDIQLKPGDNILTGRVRMTAGSTLNGIDLGQTITQLGDKADAALGNAAAAQSSAQSAQTAANNAQTAADNAQSSADQANTTANETATTVANLSTGNQNLLRNSGFTGDYLPEDSATSVEVNDGTFLFSNPFDHWTTTNATAVSSIESITGMAVVLANGSLQQTLETSLIANENYIFSFKAKGTSISFTIGSYSYTQALTNTTTRYTFKFVAQSASTAFAITSSTCTVMELQLIQGTVPNTDWINSPLDNDKTLAYFQNLTYLTNAIVNGSTSILGGLILSNQIRVGNYRNGSMIQETGGIASQSSYEFEESGGTSGLYSGPDSPFLWGGGTMEKAFYTIAKYAENPNYEPTASELANLMAQFVVTHGGRAILNDIIARGVIIATSGIFKNIASPNGNFQIDANGDMKVRNATISGNMYAPMLSITPENFAQYTNPEIPGSRTLLLALSGLNVKFEGLDSYTAIRLPGESQYLGAIARIYNNTISDLLVVGIIGTYAHAGGTEKYFETQIRSIDIRPNSYQTFQCQYFSPYSYSETVEGHRDIEHDSSMQTIVSGLTVGDVVEISCGIVKGNGGYKVMAGSKTLVDTINIEFVSERMVGRVFQHKVVANQTIITANVADGSTLSIAVNRRNRDAGYFWTQVAESNIQEGAKDLGATVRMNGVKGLSVGYDPYITDDGYLRFRTWTRPDDDMAIHSNG